MASPSPHHFCWGWGWTSFVYSTRGLVQHKNNGILFPQVSDGWTVEPLFEDVWTEPNTSKTLICCQVTLWRPNQWTKKHWHWAQNPKVLIHEIYLPCSSISPVVFVKKKVSIFTFRNFQTNSKHQLMNFHEKWRETKKKTRHLLDAQLAQWHRKIRKGASFREDQLKKHPKSPFLPENMVEKNMTNDGLPWILPTLHLDELSL